MCTDGRVGLGEKAEEFEALSCMAHSSFILNNRKTNSNEQIEKPFFYPTMFFVFENLL